MDRQRSPIWEWGLTHTPTLDRLLETGFESNFTLVLGQNGEQVKVHKIFLQAKSSILYSMIKSSGETDKLVLEDVEDTKVFKMMLKYFYTGSSGAHMRQALPLLKFAKEFEVAELIQQCNRLLEGAITDDKVLPLFEDSIKYGNQGMRKRTLRYICSHAKDVLQLPEFANLRLLSLTEIIQQDDLGVEDEMEVFKAVYRWGHAECERLAWNGSDPITLRRAITTPLTFIRFPLMDAEDFALHVATKQLLTSEEVLALTLYFHVSMDKRSQLPDGRFNAKSRKYKKVAPTMLYLPESEAFSWFPTAMGHVPPGAVGAGEGGEPNAFIARAWEGRELIPGKLVKDKAAFVCTCWKEVWKTEYEVLVLRHSSLEFVWVPHQGSQPPQNAVVGGHRGNPNDKLWVARAKHNGMWVPGKYHPPIGATHVPFDGGEHAYENFQVLTVRSKQKNVHVVLKQG